MPNQLKLLTSQVISPEITKSDPADIAAEALDRMTHAGLAQATAGLSPSVLAEAWTDWAVHLASSPGKQMHLRQQAMRDGQAFLAAWLGLRPEDAGPDDLPDRRYADAAWQKWPFNVWSAAHERSWRWWQDAVTGVHGMTPEHETLMALSRA